MSNHTVSLEGVSCPACEYERGTKGRPERYGGEVFCLDCKTKWREYSDLTYQPEMQPTNIEKRPTVSSTDMVAFMRSELQKQDKSNYQNGFEYREEVQANRFRPVHHAAFTGAAFAVCLTVSILFVDSLNEPNLDYTVTASIAKKPLVISDVQLNETVRPDGKKVFKVTGAYSNTSKTTQNLPRIALTLRQEDGTPIFQWYYTAPIPSMKAGRKLQFSTAVQYDTPIRAVIDARFE